ncbi:reverse transcriptase domain-containing protein [Tanacetum coccineum]
MPVACHMFTYTLKDFTHIWWNSQKAVSILNYEDLKAKFRSHFNPGFTRRAMNLRFCSWLENKNFGRASLHGPSIHLQRGQKNKDRFSPYWGPNHGLLPSKSPKEILVTEKATRSFEPPLKMFGSKRSRDMSKYCHLHEDYGHDTNDCRHLRTLIQEAVNSGQLSHLVKGIKKERTKSSDPPRGEIRKDKGKAPAETPILMQSCFEKLNPTIKATKVDLKTPFVGFSREHSWSISKVSLEITIGDAPLSRTKTLNFMIVRSDSTHNMLLGRTAMQRMGIVVSTIHRAIKFHTKKGIETILSTDQANEGTKRARKMPAIMTIGKHLPDHFKKEMQNLLKSNADVFAWIHADMKGILRTIMVKGKPLNMEHKLNEYNHIKPIKQNKRNLANPVMVKKSDGGWRMHVDFIDINKACSKDCYPIPEIDWKIESLLGVHLKYFLDSYKGYHQIQMAEEDKDKTTFYTEEGVFCYRKMSFSIKNVGETYQRLVDKVFSHQIGRNLEAYVDDMVIKSTSEKEMLKDIQETFRRFQSINMKLNPKKCSFGVEEGPFLGHLITKHGIKANHLKVKVVTDLDQPRTLKDI